MRQNNFDFLRLIFALSVLISHSFGLSGSSTPDWLVQLTHDQASLARLGVEGFFIISGYLIFQSQERSKGILNFYWKRVLRIFPGLLVVLLLTIPFCYLAFNGNFIEYISNKSTWTYLPKNLSLYHLQYSIKGVFENNPVPLIINLPLWTITYEFFCYIILSSLILLRAAGKKLFIVILYALLIIAKFVFYDYIKDVTLILKAGEFIDLGLFFFAGSALALFRIERIKYRTVPSSLCFIVLIFSVNFQLYNSVHYFALPFIVITLGLASTKYISGLGEKFGDLSYGIYIYAFPLQQFLVYFLKLNYTSLIIYSSTLSLLFGYLSWHLIEKRALRLKKRYT